MRSGFECIGALLAAIALAGCGGRSHAGSAEPELQTAVPTAAVTTDSSAFFGSGTRLKAHMHDGGSGARSLIDFYDSTLDTNCDFVENASGEYHCLPNRLADSYFDSACTVPAFGSNGETLQAGMLVRGYSYDCNVLATPYSLVEEQPVTQLYVLIGGTCDPATVFPDRAWTLHPEPLAHFAGAALSEVGDAGEAQALRATSEDGAYVNLYPTTQGERCTSSRFGPDERCVRVPIAHVTQAYADNECSGPELALWSPGVSDQCAGRSPTRAVVTTAQTCGLQNTLHELAGPAPAAFSLDGSGCEKEDAAFFGESFYQVGVPVSPTEAPVLGIATVGTGALTLRATANRLGTPLESLGEWQLADGEPCAQATDSNGVLRCAPGVTAIPAYEQYGDANCTELLASVSASNCGPAPSYYLLESQSGSNSGALTLTSAHAAEPHTGLVYTQQASGCQPIQASTSFKYYQAGSVVDVATFPVIAETTDP